MKLKNEAWYGSQSNKSVFFLTALKNGNVDDVKYRKALISMFVNKIYLYDDKITFIFNSKDIPVTVDADLIDFIDEQNLSANNANEFKFSTKCSTKTNIIRKRLHYDNVTIANENRCPLIQGQWFSLKKQLKDKLMRSEILNCSAFILLNKPHIFHCYYAIKIDISGKHLFIFERIFIRISNSL